MKGPTKRDKPRSKLTTKKASSRRQEPRSYLGNYDSRKEQRKMIQSNVSVRNRRAKTDVRPDEHQSQGSTHLYATSSEAGVNDKIKTKSTFFKKKTPDPQNIRSPVTGYKTPNRLKTNNKVGGFLSKTDDLKFLKEIRKDGKNRAKSRRGSSAYPKDKTRTVQFALDCPSGTNFDESNLQQDPKTLLSSHNISEQRDGEDKDVWSGKYAMDKEDGISKSLVVEKPKREMDMESQSHRETVSEIEYLKRKYFGKGSTGSKEPKSTVKDTPTWKFLKPSTKNTKKKGRKKIKGHWSASGKEVNERSKSSEQGPTYLENLPANIEGPKKQRSSKDEKNLDNFYVISSHQSNEQSKLSEKGDRQEKRNNNPAIGVEGLHQSHPVNRNR